MESLPDVTLEAPAQHTTHAGRYRRGQALPVGLGSPESRADVSEMVVRAERLMRREHLVQHARRRPTRRLRASIRSTADLLRAHVARRSGQRSSPAAHARSRQGHGYVALVPTTWPRQTEVEHLHRAGRVNLMFAGLRSRWMIPFSCAASSASAIWRATSSASSSGNGPPDRRSASVGPSTSSITMACRPPAISRPWIVRDVRMVQRREQPRFALQPRDPIRIARERRRQHLDGDLPMQPRIERTIHLAHATGVQRTEDAISPELESGRQRRAPGQRSSRRAESCHADRAARRTIPPAACAAKQRLHVIARGDVVAARLSTNAARRSAGCVNAASKMSLTRGHRRAFAHDGRAARPSVMRRYSQARADCHSRVIVARDNDRTAADLSSTARRSTSVRRFGLTLVEDGESAARRRA